MNNEVSKHRFGAIAELLFKLRMLEQNLVASDPVYPVPYDVLVEVEGVFVRVQIKHAGLNEDNVFRSRLTKSRQVKGKCRVVPYSSDEIDVLAILVENDFYLVRCDSNTPSSFAIKPEDLDNPNNKWAPHKNNWGLLYQFAATQTLGQSDTVFNF